MANNSLRELFPTKLSLFVFIGYILLFVNQGILVTASQEGNSAYDYNFITVVLFTEILKLVISCILYCKEHSSKQLVIEIVRYKNVLALYVVPAFLYCLYNNLSFVNLSSFDPTTYYLLLQFRVVVTGVLFQVIFKKVLSKKQWLSLFLLTFGCMLKQVNFSEETPILNSKSTSIHLGSYTCISCRVAFKDADLQRMHYKTDWHRYNLKRKVASLPPVTAEEFQKKVHLQRSNDQQMNQDTTVYCAACHKSFCNKNAFENHLNSKKHKENEKTFEIGGKVSARTEENISLNSKRNQITEIDDSGSDIEEVDSDEWEDDVQNPIDNNDCIFCAHHSRNFIKNLEHMTVVHSFFIPDIEFCSDVTGLLRYLGDKVNEGFMCLWCNESGRTFHTAEAARQHMLDKGHCKMIHEGAALAEYSDYYDYSSSYPDAEKEDVNLDEEVSVPELSDSDYQLVLPSGITLGHRSLMRYYKQRLNPDRQLVPAKNNKKLHKVLATYRSLGWTETQQEAAARRARDVHFLKRVHSKYMLKMNMKNNRLLQKHFRIRDSKI